MTNCGKQQHCSSVLDEKCFELRRNLDHSKAQLAHRSSAVSGHLSSVMHITLVTKHHLFHVRRCMLQSNQLHALPLVNDSSHDITVISILTLTITVVVRK